MNAGDITLQRRLAAILVADVVGYSSLMARDEEGTFAMIRHLMRDEIGPRIRQHDGRIVRTTGDGIIAEFPSAVEAVRSAVEVQELLVRQSLGQAAPGMLLRIGINFGDIIIDFDGDVFGDGVNVPPVSNRSRAQAASAFPERCMKKFATSFLFRSNIGASSISRTFHARLPSTRCSRSRQGCRPVRPHSLLARASPLYLFARSRALATCNRISATVSRKMSSRS